MEQSVAQRYGRRWSAGAAVRAERFADTGGGANAAAPGSFTVTG